MSRANNGVRSKVEHDVKIASPGGRMGTERGEGGAPNQETFTPREEDQSRQRGPYSSTIQAGHGTEKNMGGVGDYGLGADMHKKGYFEDKH